jgi:hypothetical protein
MDPGHRGTAHEATSGSLKSVMSRSDIWLSDLLYSIERLSIRDPATVRLVLQMLKLEHVDTSAALPAVEPVVPASTPTPPSPQGSNDVPPVSSASDVAANGGSTEVRRASLRPVDAPGTQSLPQWYTEVTSLSRRVSPPPVARMSRPLFPVRQSRALLSAALATWDSDGSPDIPRIIEILASAQPIRTLPQLTAPTLRRGCQILIDTAVSMAPFRLDVEHLITRIHAVIAKDRVEIRDFTGCPMRSARTPARNETTSWRAPAPGTPIFLLTDLGIGGPAASEERAGIGEWLEFAQSAQAAGCPVVALVPYASSRWPRALRGHINVIHWDRRTTAAAIRKRSLPDRRAP